MNSGQSWICRPVRLRLQGRDSLENRRVIIDGAEISAEAGDTLLMLLLRERGFVRHAEFGSGPRERAGFCLMGACQDCWVTLVDGRRLRACTTLAEDGMHLVTDRGNGAA